MTARNQAVMLAAADIRKVDFLKNIYKLDKKMFHLSYKSYL